MRLLLSILFLCFSFFLKGTHIIGGVAQYAVVDASDALSTSVRLTFTLYRDALSSGSGFDILTTFGIYQKDTNGDYIYIGEEQVNDHSDPSVFNFDANYVLQSADYTFEVNLDKGSDYIIAYQRCCRSILTTNIQNDETGFAIQLELFSEALEVEIDSPTVIGIPFAEANLGEDISYQLPITSDTQTVVSTHFTSAFIAGGSFDSTGPNAGVIGCCDCVRPNPSLCNPPFKSILFANGYSDEDPFGDENNIRLNSDGLITGEVNLASIYHYGIAIESRVNGQLLSRQILDNTARALFTSTTKDVEQLSFEILPNPASDLLDINVMDYTDLRLEIIDSQGHLIMNRVLTKKKTTVAVNHLDSGIYFATIMNTDNSQRQTQKFTIQ